MLVRFLYSLCLVAWLLNVETSAQDKYAVLIGVETYDPSVLSPLDYAEDDAIALGESLSELGFKAKVMTGQANISTAKPNSPQKILTVLETQMNNCAAGDTIVISFSGHGLQFEDDEPDENGVRETYFCPEDADPENRESLLKISEVVELLEQCPASRKLLLVDACRNEFAKSDGQRKAAKKLKLASVHETQLNIPGGMSVLFSCDQKQHSYEHDQLEHSVFTYFVVKYLSGNAEQKYYEDGKIDFDSLMIYVRKRTNEYVFENGLSADGQAPVLSGSSSNWILGTSVNPVRSLLQKHIEWMGGVGNFRKIKSLKTTRDTEITDSTGQVYTFRGIDYINPEMVVRDTIIDGQTLRQGNTRDIGWVTEMDGSVRAMDNEERDMSWLTSHPIGMLEMLDRYDEFKLGKKVNVDGVETTELYFGDLSSSYFKMNIDNEGRIRAGEMKSRGQTVRSRPKTFETINGLKLTTSVEVEIENDTFRATGTTTASSAADVKIDPQIFAVPTNVPVKPKTSLNINKIVKEYNSYREEFLADSNGTLSDVKFRKISADTIAVDLLLAPGMFERISADFWNLNTLKAGFIETDLDEEDREIVKSGINLMITYKKQDGTSAGQFYVTENDFK